MGNGKGVGIARGEGDFIIYYTGTNEATDTDPCLILAGTSLKVVERLMQLGWKRGKINLSPFFIHFSLIAA